MMYATGVIVRAGSALPSVGVVQFIVCTVASPVVQTSSVTGVR